MLLFDVNVLINAHQENAKNHPRYRSFFEDVVNGSAPFGMSELVCSAFVRIMTDPRAYVAPTPIDTAVRIVHRFLSQENCHRVQPGARHFQIFSRLCIETPVRGKGVSDAYLAALAIESGCEWVTDDRGFARYPGLRWRRPLDP
ncbi:type II toxin-antitoxin system VapC family toxin [soil metagenome]|jgi:toxin-antitoxin system PIN domain toxin